MALTNAWWWMATASWPRISPSRAPSSPATIADGAAPQDGFVGFAFAGRGESSQGKLNIAAGNRTLGIVDHLEVGVRLTKNAAKNVGNYFGGEQAGGPLKTCFGVRRLR